MRRFVVVVCDDSLAWSPEDFGAMFIHHLSTNPDNNEREGNDNDAEEWTSINCARGEPVPRPEDGYHGVVITGSRFNVRDRETLPWFEPLCDLVRFASSRGFPNIYGGCFGCQLVAFALGGEVDYNPGKRFLLKAETIRLDQNVINSTRAFQSSSSSSYSPLSHTDQGDNSSSLVDRESLKLIVSHGDCVVTLPPSGVLLGCSDSCSNEMFLCGDVTKNIMGVQAHPEFDYKYAIQQRIWKSVVEKSKKLSETEIEIASESFATYTNHDALVLMKHVARFIRQ